MSETRCEICRVALKLVSAQKVVSTQMLLIFRRHFERIYARKERLKVDCVCITWRRRRILSRMYCYPMISHILVQVSSEKKMKLSSKILRKRIGYNKRIRRVHCLILTVIFLPNANVKLMFIQNTWINTNWNSVQPSVCMTYSLIEMACKGLFKFFIRQFLNCIKLQKK